MEKEEKKEFISDIVGKISHGSEEDYSEQMPSFDLGQQILAQQRKIAALKRKSPVSSSIPADEPKPAPIQIKPFQSPVYQPLSPQQKIIADIVAREIRDLTSIR